MLGDLFKIFIEEPEKLTRVALRAINTIFHLIIAEYLYRHFFGNYTLMKLGDYKDWADFILTGRILFCIACYLISKYLIQPLVAAIIYLIVAKLFCSTKLFKVKQADLKFLLNFLDIVKINKGEDIPTPGKNIEILYTIAKDFESETEIKNYELLKDSLLEDVLNSYAIFIILYYLSFDHFFQNDTFKYIMLYGFVIVVILYVFFNGVIEMMRKDYKQILEGLYFIKINHIINQAFVKRFISIYKPDDEKKYGKEKFFEYFGKSYVLIIDFSNRPLKLKGFESYLNNLASINRHLFLITHNTFEPSNYPELQKHSNQFTIVSYQNEDDLGVQIQKQLFDKIIN